MQVNESAIEMVGATPLVRLRRMAASVPPQVLAKVEYLNPGGSVKDRIALAMVEDAEERGLIRPGGTIVEPTSGNTGVGLALVANARGYRCVFVMPDKVSAEKIAVLRAYGAETVVCPAAVPPDHPDSYYSVSKRLTGEIPGAWSPNQYANPLNTHAHYRTTGPEVWSQTDGRVTHFVTGVGTGGTISGAGRYLKEVSHGRVHVIGAAPEGSVYTQGDARPYLVEGVGQDFVPASYDPTVADRIIAVSDSDAFHMTRRLARQEALLVGGSSGLAVAATLRLAAGLTADDVMVVLLPDSGRGYLSKVYNDGWIAHHGFLVPTPPNRQWETCCSARAASCPSWFTYTPRTRSGPRSRCCVSTASARCPSCAETRPSWWARWWAASCSTCCSTRCWPTGRHWTSRSVSG